MIATNILGPVVLAGLAVHQYFLYREHKQIMSALDDLTAQVAATKTVAQSAVTLIQGLADALKNTGTQDPAILAIVKDLQDTDKALADAVAANTPSAPVTPNP